jgi:formamidopyrimidine-DNA glycosylase
MPELPEVESLRRLLARSIVGRMIVSARVLEPRLRRRVARDFEKSVAGRRILGLSRRAKYLILELSGGGAMLVHLGMSGSLTHRGASPKARNADDASDNAAEDAGLGALDPSHDHIEFILDDGTRLVYNDPRRFGLLKLLPLERLSTIDELRSLGPEPLSTAFNADYLLKKARGRRVAIKNLLMDQRIVAGIGNIYAAEILFRAGVRPMRRAGRLTRREIEAIVAAAPAVLREAIGGRGTTFRSYRDSRGRPGRFASRLRVYGREGKPCYTCSTPIRNVVVGQRASFFCPTCQK